MPLLNSFLVEYNSVQELLEVVEVVRGGFCKRPHWAVLDDAVHTSNYLWEKLKKTKVWSCWMGSFCETSGAGVAFVGTEPLDRPCLQTPSHHAFQCRFSVYAALSLADMLIGNTATGVHVNLRPFTRNQLTLDVVQGGSHRDARWRRAKAASNSAESSEEEGEESGAGSGSGADSGTESDGGARRSGGGPPEDPYAALDEMSDDEAKEELRHEQQQRLLAASQACPDPKRLPA